MNSITIETATTPTPSTTAPAPPPAQVSSDEARAHVDAGLMTGDCFTQAVTADQTTRTPVPWDEPHDGEVIATGPTGGRGW